VSEWLLIRGRYPSGFLRVVTQTAHNELGNLRGMGYTGTFNRTFQMWRRMAGNGSGHY